VIFVANSNFAMLKDSPRAFGADTTMGIERKQPKRWLTESYLRDSLSKHPCEIERLHTFPNA